MTQTTLSLFAGLSAFGSSQPSGTKPWPTLSPSVWVLCLSLIFNSLSLSENGFGGILDELQHACYMRWGLSSGIEKTSV